MTEIINELRKPKYTTFQFLTPFHILHSTNRGLPYLLDWIRVWLSAPDYRTTPHHTSTCRKSESFVMSRETSTDCLVRWYGFEHSVHCLTLSIRLRHTTFQPECAFVVNKETLHFFEAYHTLMLSSSQV